eukprot:gene7949-46453_t
MFVVQGQWVIGTLLQGLPCGFLAVVSLSSDAGFGDGLAFGLVTATVGLLGAVTLGVAVVNGERVTTRGEGGGDEVWMKGVKG